MSAPGTTKGVLIRERACNVHTYIDSEYLTASKTDSHTSLEARMSKLALTDF